MERKAPVFISYCTKDNVVVNKVVMALEKMGIPYWKAPEMIPAGSSYAREIPKAIRECEVFLLILSRNSQASIWVEKEIDNAVSNRKLIIPLQLDADALNDAYKFYLNNVQMISYYVNENQAMSELMSQLAQYKVVQNPSQEVTPNHSQEVVKIHSQAGMSFARTSNDKRKLDSNALRMNRIPIECKQCKSKELEYVAIGTYRCTACGTDNYDDFQTVRNYLSQVGNAPAIVIERETGVPRRVIDYFFKKEFLEIPSSSAIRVPCSVCGAPIRTGTMCDSCKAKKSSAAGTKRASDGMNKNSQWHSSIRRK